MLQNEKTLNNSNRNITASFLGRKAIQRLVAAPPGVAGQTHFHSGFYQRLLVYLFILCLSGGHRLHNRKRGAPAPPASAASRPAVAKSLAPPLGGAGWLAGRLSGQGKLSGESCDKLVRRDESKSSRLLMNRSLTPTLRHSGTPSVRSQLD